MTFILKPEHAQQFQQLICAEAESAQMLMEVLESEHQVLVQGKADDIRAISQQKQGLVRKMAEQLLLRDRFLAGLGLPAGSKGTSAFIEHAQSAPALEQAWSQIEMLAPRLSDQNEINGGIVSLAQRHVREALNILTNHNEQSPTYGRGGIAAERSPQSLAKA